MGGGGGKGMSPQQVAQRPAVQQAFGGPPMSPQMRAYLEGRRPTAPGYNPAEGSRSKNAEVARRNAAQVARKSYGRAGGVGAVRPQTRAAAKDIAKGAAAGSAFGPFGAFLGALYGATKGGPNRTRGGSGEFTPTRRGYSMPAINPATNRCPQKVSGNAPGSYGPLPNPRASMPGRPLSGGQIPMRSGSSYGRYRGPYRHSSILGGSDDNSLGELGDTGSYDEAGIFQ